MRSGEFAVPFPRFFVGLPTCAQGACSAGHPRDCGFRVAWSINPHMRPGSADPRAAARQHAAFVARLEDLGATVIALPFVHGAYDSVFMKDAALVVMREGRTRALPATFATPERAPETAARTRQLSAQGFSVAEPLATPLEGGDIALLPGGGALLGYGFRSSATSSRGLSAFLDEEVNSQTKFLKVSPSLALVTQTSRTRRSCRRRTQWSRTSLPSAPGPLTVVASSETISYPAQLSGVASSTTSAIISSTNAAK